MREEEMKIERPNQVHAIFRDLDRGYTWTPDEIRPLLDYITALERRASAGKVEFEHTIIATGNKSRMNIKLRSFDPDNIYWGDSFDVETGATYHIRVTKVSR